MKLFRKFLTIFMSFGLLFIMAGCSAIGDVEKKLEDAGYTVEKLSDEEFDDLVEDADEDEDVDLIKAIYEVYNEEEEYVAIIIEFNNENALEDYFEGAGESLDFFEEYIYKNIYVSSTNLIEIIKE